MSPPAAQVKEGVRSNPGYVVIEDRGGDVVHPILHNGFRETLFAVAKMSEGRLPVPFIWVGQCNLVIADPQIYAFTDLTEIAGDVIPGIPRPVTYETAPDSLFGSFVVMPGGIVRKVITHDALKREWGEDPGAIVSLGRLLDGLKHEGCLMRDSEIDWAWVAPGGEYDRFRFIGTAGELL